MNLKQLVSLLKSVYDETERKTIHPTYDEFLSVKKEIEKNYRIQETPYEYSILYRVFDGEIAVLDIIREENGRVTTF